MKFMKGVLYYLTENNRMKKVYCKKCLYFYEAYGSSRVECNHPDNKIVYDQWDEIKYSNKESPKVINAENDCKWFKEK